MSIQVDKVVDAKGLACPMPIVRTKKSLSEVEAGQVVEVQATDKGSLADIQSWAKSTGHQYLGSSQDGDVLHHYIRKSGPEEVKEERKFQHTITNEQLEQLLQQSKLTIIDVREPAEYAFGHIPGSVSIPLGVLEEKLAQLNKEDELYIICRTGSRSDMAAQLLADNGFTQVKNVLPGMSQWNGAAERV